MYSSNISSCEPKVAVVVGMEQHRGSIRNFSSSRAGFESRHYQVSKGSEKLLPGCRHCQPIKPFLELHCHCLRYCQRSTLALRLCFIAVVVPVPVVVVVVVNDNSIIIVTAGHHRADAGAASAALKPPNSAKQDLDRDRLETIPISIPARKRVKTT